MRKIPDQPFSLFVVLGGLQVVTSAFFCHFKGHRLTQILAINFSPAIYKTKKLLLKAMTGEPARLRISAGALNCGH